MDNTLFVANWKSYKTRPEAKEWLEAFTLEASNKKIIICPPYTLLDYVSSYIKDKGLGLHVGAQNISVFKEGAHTGEVNGRQIRELAEYVIIGHSERRIEHGEREEDILDKLKIAIEEKLIPILCISEESHLNILNSLQNETVLVAYEPISAIGTGSPASLESALMVADKVRKIGKYRFLYGGSVTSENVKHFTSSPQINGVLVGSASLLGKGFYQIVKNG